MPTTQSYCFSQTIAWSATIIAAATMDIAPEVSCVSAAILGGAVSQLLSYESRKPSRLVLIGELCASAIMGYAVFAFLETSEPKTLLAAIFSGGGGSFSYHKLVDKYAEKVSEWFGK